eukprot:379784_1
MHCLLSSHQMHSASNGHNGWICGNYDAIQITRLWNGHMIRQILKASRTCRHQKECIKHKEAAPRNICKYVVHHQKGTTDPKGTTQPLEMIHPMHLNVTECTESNNASNGSPI